MKRNRGWTGYLIVLAAFLAVALLLNGSMFAQPSREVTYAQLWEMIDKGEVKSVAIRGTNLWGLKNGSETPESRFPERAYDFEATITDIESFRQEAYKRQAKVLGVSPESVGDGDLPYNIIPMPPETVSIWVTMIPSLLTIGIMIFFMVMLMRAQGGGNGKVMNFGKSRARVNDPSKNKITFADVAGADEEKEELQEMVDFLRNPRTYIEMGARIPKGVLLVGPPRTGKTLLAKAVAGEAGEPIFSISGSDFVEMFVGVGASRVRDLFDQAKRSAPAIVFIDEIDAVGRHRGAGLGGGHDEREQTLNQLLVEMDGFAVNEGVIVMAATNRRDILDPALLRPGRFDRTITVNYPDLDGRVAIMKVHTKGKPLAEDVDLKVLAKRTPFATGADLENMMNEAAILAARARRKEIDQQLMLDAIARIQMGPEKRSHKVTDNDRRMVAIHEGGHAIVSHVLPEADDVHLVTIVPRGRTGGHTLSLPSTEDEFTMQNQLMAEIATLMGGHAAEKLVLGEYSVGSTSDLQRATELCRRMVTMFGMSDEIGPVYLDNDQEVFVGMEFGQSRGYSEETASRIDAEVKKLCQQCYDMAVKALTENREKLDLLTEALLKHETLSRQEFVSLMETGVIPEITSANKPRSLHEILEESKAQEDAEASVEENAAADGNKPDEEIVKKDEA